MALQNAKAIAPVCRFLYWPDVTAMVGLSRRQLERLEADGRFPIRVKIGTVKTGFYRHEVEKWLATRARVR